MNNIQIDFSPFEKCVQCPVFREFASQLVLLEAERNVAYENGLGEPVEEYVDEISDDSMDDEEIENRSKWLRLGIVEELDSIDEQVEEASSSLILLAGNCRGPQDVENTTKSQRTLIRYCDSLAADRFTLEEMVEIHRITPITKPGIFKRILGVLGIEIELGDNNPESPSSSGMITLVDNGLFDSKLIADPQPEID
ncbi:MAG: hypothetical protein M3P98_01130 [bacterium]|nr:hypothetical protein [bacterium]